MNLKNLTLKEKSIFRLPFLEENLVYIDSILPQNALKRDCNGKCIELIEGHYLEVVVLL